MMYREYQGECRLVLEKTHSSYLLLQDLFSMLIQGPSERTHVLYGSTTVKISNVRSGYFSPTVLLKPKLLKSFRFLPCQLIATYRCSSPSNR
ncbi:unnamed protein product [Acanthoscelides obtectus]|uniref:Uncharacterized protein n=1 Tax=Acanthoscelides obtectus TaxID=200917 RepID=A0A9P0Q632_ACAOB|nr:unnamed protein product [Acanthoscelides obtectus]CAK1625973.1 hypothetical protein AOBTE_LOCUS3511 [Acanthoscelides obtectus]